MKKISVLFILSILQTSMLAAEVLPALSQLGDMSPANISGISFAVPSVPVVVKEDNWAVIVEKTIASGLFTEPDGDIPASRYFADIIGPKNGPHKADYFSGWGYINESGALGPDFVTMVSENWEITPDGNWRIDQWIHWLTPAGVPQQVSHNVIVEAMSGQILDTQMDQLEVADPRAEENRKDLIEKWYLYRPEKFARYFSGRPPNWRVNFSGRLRAEG
jgi:hypothetical protein